MGYMIRSKGRDDLRMRDPSDGEMKILNTKDFISFGELPAGVGAVGDGDVEVKELVKAPMKKKAKKEDSESE